MKRATRNGGIAAGIGVAFVCWLGTRVPGTDPPPPSRADPAREPRPAVAGQPVDARARQRLPDPADAPVAALPETDGLGVAAFLARVTPSARRGDSAAAYRAYRAEALCAAIDLLKRVDPREDDDDRASLARHLARLIDACDGVTPAEIGERFVFLEQAIRAGDDRAKIDYAREGPNGLPIETLDPRDPNVLAWRRNAHAYLEDLAARGNDEAWVMLAQQSENGGPLADRDVGAAIAYWTAMQVSRKPDVDPRSIAFIAELTTRLPAADADQAIARGRALGLRFARLRAAPARRDA